MLSNNNLHIYHCIGPLSTDMQREIRENCSMHEATQVVFLLFFLYFIDCNIRLSLIIMQTMFKKMHEEGKLVSPEESAAKCVEIILRDVYANGASIDFYDEWLSD